MRSSTIAVDVPSGSPNLPVAEELLDERSAC
jgi:hypothetical protein